MRVLRSIAVVVAALAPATGVAATLIDDLYQAQTIVTGQGEPNRLIGFGPAFEDVLVKVSGDPTLIGNRQVVALASRAASFVAGFKYHDRMSGIPTHDEQGTRDRPYDLIVDFDPAKIDETLHALGREPWKAPRPQLVLLLAVRYPAATNLLSSDGDRGYDQRLSLAAAIAKRGMPIALPTAKALADAHITFDRVAAGDVTQFDGFAKTLGGDGALIGKLTWVDTPAGWNSEWQASKAGTIARWRFVGPSFDDAFRNALAGAAQIFSGHGQPASN